MRVRGRVAPGGGDVCLRPRMGPALEPFQRRRFGGFHVGASAAHLTAVAAAVSAAPMPAWFMALFVYVSVRVCVLGRWEAGWGGRGSLAVRPADAGAAVVSVAPGAANIVASGLDAVNVVAPDVFCCTLC